MADDDTLDFGDAYEEGQDGEENGLGVLQELEEGRRDDGESSNDGLISSQETDYITPTSSPSASFGTRERLVMARGRLAGARNDSPCSLGATTSASTSTSAAPGLDSPFFPPASAVFTHPNANPTRATSRPTGPPTGTPTGPRNFRRPWGSPNVSPSTRPSTTPTPRPSTLRRMTQQNTAAFQRHVGSTAGEYDNSTVGPVPTTKARTRKAASPTLPEPEYPSDTLLWQPKRNENAADNKRRIEQNEIALEKLIRRHDGERQQEQIARQREIQMLDQRMASLERQTPVGAVNRAVPDPSSSETSVMGFALQQLGVQQQLMTRLMDWQIQWSGQRTMREPFGQEMESEDTPSASSRWKRARSGSPLSSASRHYPRRRLSRRVRSPTTSGDSCESEEECYGEAERVVEPQNRLGNPRMEEDSAELEYMEVPPRDDNRSNDLPPSSSSPTMELDRVSLGDENDDDGVYRRDEGEDANLPRQGSVPSRDASPMAIGQPTADGQPQPNSSSLGVLHERLSLPGLQSTPSGEPSQRSLLDRIQGRPQGARSLLERLGGPTEGVRTTTSARWLTPPNCVVSLGLWYRAFDNNPTRNHTRLGRWCSMIRDRVGNLVIPFPWRFGRAHGGRALVLVFKSPADARDFVRLWNMHANCVPEAAQLVAQVDVSVPFPRTFSDVNKDSRVDSEYDSGSDCYDNLVFSWNVGGRPEIILGDDDMRRELLKYDVIMMQETHLYDTEQAPALDGFTAFSRPRPSVDFDYPWGGVTTWVRKGHTCVVREDMCAPDVLVLQVDGVLYFNVYILPTNSRRDWRSWMDVHPFEALQDAIGLAGELGFPFLVGGDLNARTESKSPAGRHPARFSMDGSADTRGRELLDFCASADLTILNGSVGIEGDHGGWTSHQKKTDRTNGQVHFACAVVDYMISSESCRDWVQRFDVSERTEWSDHSYLSLRIRIPGGYKKRENHRENRKRSRPQFDLPRNSELDVMYADLMDKEPKSIEEKLDDLYGRVHLPDPNAREVCVYTDGSCMGNGNNRRAGAGLFYGHNSQLNQAYRVPGPQTNTRAELFAIYVAILRAPGNRTLRIFTDSEYAIKSLTHWAPKRSACGWDCVHGDLLSDIVKAIRRRDAPLHLRWVRAHNGNDFNEHADRLAKEGAGKPLPLEPLESYLGVRFTCTDTGGLDQPVSGPSTSRVVTNLPSVTPPKQTGVSREGSFNRKSHRGRAYRRIQQKQVLQKLMQAAENSSGQFWRLYKKLRYPKAQSSDATMAQLMDVFIPRMNPPDPQEKGFDETLLRHYQSQSAARAYQTPPSMFENLNLRPTTADIERVKAYLDARRHSDTKGVDESAYSDLMEMDNDDICSLLDKCFETSDVPGAWLTSLITAIPKVGKDTSDPRNYRTIALESCFLKFAMLLVQMKLTDAAEAAGLIPPSQNGFRKGFRTQNNGFILRSLIEKSRAMGETLYVAFVDISNAFPSTNQDVLWARLETCGMTGRYFDWLRAVYNRMRYMISLEGELSPEFQALSGVLIGDPASPLLWNLFLAALAIPEDVDDADLEGVKISHLEHADDMVIMSRTAAGLQRHLNHLDQWCRDNFLELSPSKSKIMQFGPLLTKHCEFTGDFTMAGTLLELVKQYKYVGILFTSVQRDIFERCYTEKARKARASGCGIFGTDRLIGRRRLPPSIARNLYTALVDCHLIFGTEVIVDVGTKGPMELVDVQKKFLRRMLGLSKKSTLAGLFTETALLLLQSRRIILTLGYLAYLLKRMKEEYDEGLQPSYTSLALRASSRLRDANEQCWLMDIDWVLQNLPGSEGSLQLPSLESMTVDLVTDLMTRTSSLACQQLQNQIDTNSKLTLLRGRIEPVDPATKDSPRHHTLYARHYLKQVHDHRHRVILTRLLLGDLCPSVFRARAGKEYIQTDNWVNLTCRGCGSQYETPEHVIFRCMGDVELGRIRLLLVRDIAKRWGDWRTYQTAPLEMLKRCIFDWDFVSKFASALLAIVLRWRERVKTPIKVFDDDMTDGDSEGE